MYKYLILIVFITFIITETNSQTDNAWANAGDYDLSSNSISIIDDISVFSKELKKLYNNIKNPTCPDDIDKTIWDKPRIHKDINLLKNNKDQHKKIIIDWKSNIEDRKNTISIQIESLQTRIDNNEILIAEEKREKHNMKRLKYYEAQFNSLINLLKDLDSLHTSIYGLIAFIEENLPFTIFDTDSCTLIQEEYSNCNGYCTSLDSLKMNIRDAINNINNNNQPNHSFINY